MRDALSIMDQAIASAPLVDGRAVLQTEQIRDLMGSVPNAVFERLLESVSAQNSAQLMVDLDQLISSGNSPSALARQLVRYLRNCLMAKLGGESTQLLAIAQDERARAARTALLFTEEDLTRNLQIALRTFDELNYKQEQRFHLELGLLKLIQAQRLLPIEEILSGLTTPGAPRKAASSPLAPPSRPTAQAAPRPAAAPALSPFGASHQRSAEVPISRPARDTPTASIERESYTTAPAAVQAAPSIAAHGAYSVTTKEAITEGALALAEQPEPPEPPDASSLALGPESGPQIVPSLRAGYEPEAEPGDGSDAEPVSELPAPPASGAVDLARAAVSEALNAGGHATAALLLDDGQWTIEGSSVKIAVNAKATMIRITFNANAEKFIRQGLAQAGAPTRFMVVPGGQSSPNAPNYGSSQPRAPQGSIEAEARTNPLVAQAQSLFNAEIVSVVDLRDK
jgi:DNA polymerase-3 subunit gamma/tau